MQLYYELYDFDLSEELLHDWTSYNFNSGKKEYLSLIGGTQTFRFNFQNKKIIYYGVRQCTTMGGTVVWLRVCTGVVFQERLDQLTFITFKSRSVERYVLLNVACFQYIGGFNKSNRLGKSSKTFNNCRRYNILIHLFYK